MNEIEEKFYKVFEIEPKRYLVDLGQWDNINNKRKPLIVPVKHKEYKKRFENNKLTPLIQIQYPPITDKILLELIYVIIRQNGSYQLHIVKDIIDLKEQILKSCILLSIFEEFKNVVQSLFTEEEE